LLAIVVRPGFRFRHYQSRLVSPSTTTA
jgi:hypothetical protein